VTAVRLRDERGRPQRRSRYRHLLWAVPLASSVLALALAPVAQGEPAVAVGWLARESMTSASVWCLSKDEARSAAGGRAATHGREPPLHIFITMKQT
jgi:hypothetical protein